MSKMNNLSNSFNNTVVLLGHIIRDAPYFEEKAAAYHCLTGLCKDWAQLVKELKPYDFAQFSRQNPEMAAELTEEPTLH